MSWKWGGWMNNKCIYYVEGPCEQQLNRYCGKLHIVFLPQVLNLEDELTRCTNVKNVSELTRSNSTRNFKTDFCRIKSKDCRAMLERHGLDTAKLWTSKVPEPFSFIENNSHQIKATYA